MNNNAEICEFIHHLFGTQDFVPLSAPKFIGNEKKYLNECIDTTFVSSVGAFVDRFEHDMAVYTGAKRTVVCVSGTNALHMAMLLVGVERDDEVLTQALTFIATCNAVTYIGAYPVFIDVDKETMGLSPRAVKAWLERNAELKEGVCYNKRTGRRVKACIPMHTFGHPVKIDELADICREWYIELVEDAAESIGSFYKGRHTGTFGKVGAISFNGNKTITTGGGGMLLFQDEELGAYAKHLTTQAKIPHRWEFRHDHIGYNYRMPNINAALGCAQLENLDRYVADKRETAACYAEFFKGKEDITFFTEPADCKSNYWLNAVVLKDKAAQLDFLEYTNDHGVMTRPVWELMNRLPMFEHCETDGLENTEWLADRMATSAPVLVRPAPPTNHKKTSLWQHRDVFHFQGRKRSAQHKAGIGRAAHAFQQGHGRGQLAQHADQDESPVGLRQKTDAILTVFLDGEAVLSLPLHRIGRGSGHGGQFRRYPGGGKARIGGHHHGDGRPAAFLPEQQGGSRPGRIFLHDAPALRQREKDTGHFLFRGRRRNGQQQDQQACQQYFLHLRLLDDDGKALRRPQGSGHGA